MKRIITGLALISVGLFVIIKNGAWLFLFLLLAGILSFYELYKMGDQNRQQKGLLLMNTLFYSGLPNLMNAYQMHAHHTTQKYHMPKLQQATKKQASTHLASIESVIMKKTHPLHIQSYEYYSIIIDLKITVFLNKTQKLQPKKTIKSSR